jgi:nucleotide-binding universal stress UspA family protein
MSHTVNASFSRILVAVDGSKNSARAVKYALMLAKNSNAAILAVNVVDLSSIFKILPTKTKKELIRLGKEESCRILDSMKNMAKQSDMPVKTEVIESSTSAGTAILNYSKQNGIDLIVIGAGEKSKATKVLLGSVASKVVAYATCPVLVVR